MKLIKLRGKYAVGNHAFAIVDDEDYERLSQYKWQAHSGDKGNSIYVIRKNKINCKSDSILMHREVIGAIKDDGFDVHHINHNSFDNQKSNLMIIKRTDHLKLHSNDGIKKNNPLDKLIKSNIKMIHQYSRICEQCKRLFICRDYRQIFCSENCRHKYHNNKKSNIYIKYCIQCSKQFKTNRSYMLFCCKKHARRWRYLAKNQ